MGGIGGINIVIVITIRDISIVGLVGGAGGGGFANLGQLLLDRSPGVTGVFARGEVGLFGYLVPIASDLVSCQLRSRWVMRVRSCCTWTSPDAMMTCINWSSRWVRVGTLEDIVGSC